MTETGTYLYAVGKQTPWQPDVSGVADTAVRTLARSGLVAYVSTVSLDEFGEAAARRNMEDLSWLERMARAHDRVVEAISRQTPTVPVRFLAVYAGDARIQDLLDRRYEDFAGMLDGVTGRTEWGVKVYADPAVLTGPAGGRAEPDQAGADERPGTTYLLRRKAATRRREDVQGEAAARAERIFATLSDLASASRRHPPQDPRLSGRDDWMVLNAAYLVDDERNEEFAAAVAAVRVDGFDVQLTGPWAPYSFTDLDLSTPDQETPP